MLHFSKLKENPGTRYRSWMCSTLSILPKVDNHLTFWVQICAGNSNLSWIHWQIDNKYAVDYVVGDLKFMHAIITLNINLCRHLQQPVLVVGNFTRWWNQTEQCSTSAAANLSSNDCKLFLNRYYTKCFILKIWDLYPFQKSQFLETKLAGLRFTLL